MQRPDNNRKQSNRHRCLPHLLKFECVVRHPGYLNCPQNEIKLKQNSFNTVLKLH